MNKLIVKTVVATIISIVVVCGLVFGALTLFAPASIAELAWKSGWNSLAVSYSEMQYKKTGSLEDLDVLLNRSVGNNGVTVKYSPEMIDNEGFTEFAKDKKAGTLDYKSYVIGNYLIALVLTGGEADEVLNKTDVYFTSFYSSAYVKYNPYDVLAVNSGRFSTAFNQALLSKLQTLSVTSGEADLNGDIILLQSAIGA
ncbi:MAG: hypothetical protein MJ072_00235 [Clostridia bacterium]|nr:hypothetical protein [Clostridia bacterium]